MDNVSTATYVYDAQGRRVQKKTSAGTVDYLYDLSGHQAAEVSSTGAWNRGEIYAAGRHLVTYSGGNSGTTYFDFTDWLGTERVRTDPTMATKETCTNLPFGDSQTCTGTNVSPLAFTGQQYDPEDNFTNFQFRQHDATQGHWLTTDPSGLAAVDPTNPQTWNRYAYAGNNPVNNVDPLGLDYAGCEGDWDPFGTCGFCNEYDFFCGSNLPCFEACGSAPEDNILLGGSPPHPRQWPDNETLGLPPGINFKALSLGDLFGLNPNGPCDFGVCEPAGSGFLGGATTLAGLNWFGALPQPLSGWDKFFMVLSCMALYPRMSRL